MKNIQASSIHLVPPGFSEDIRNAKILIVEDDRLGRAVLKEIFRSQGFSHIEEAANGKEGLEKLRVFRPDLVVTDMMMPEMDGFELCRRIRADTDPRIAGLPILVQTALSDIADKAKVFGVGATDYIVKPIDPHELVARSHVHLERQMLTRRLQDFNLRVTQELETARLTQQVIIPSSKTLEDLGKSYRMDIRGHYESCSELAGDCWGIRSLSNEKLALYMVDFAGHGVNAALNVFRLHALMHSTLSVAQTPGAYLTQLNAILAPLLPVGQFATMFYAVIDTARDVLSYAAAAAPPVLVFQDNGARHTVVENSGMLLGVDHKTVYDTYEQPFGSGDCLLMFSDALFETEDAAGDTLQIQAITEQFAGQLRSNKKLCATAFNALVDNFAERYRPHLTDDLTLSACYRIPA